VVVRKLAQLELMPAVPGFLRRCVGSVWPNGHDYITVFFLRKAAKALPETKGKKTRLHHCRVTHFSADGLRLVKKVRIAYCQEKILLTKNGKNSEVDG
jgi:hypothetical protein